VKTDKTIACWGYKKDWNGKPLGQAKPPAGTFSSVSAGGDHTCGVRTNGRVACWGNNEYGKATPPTGAFTSVSASDDHTCGVRTDRTVVCWGNNHGQSKTPPGTFASVSGGADACSLRTDG